MGHNGNIVHRYPGGIITVAGAKKKIPATFSRWWQAPIPKPNPAKCPFHKEEERKNAFLEATAPDGEQWFVLDSLFAPEKPHRLIIPDTCWEEEKMRVLGGPESIRTAVALASRQFGREQPEERDKLWGFSVQVGPLAAQNVPHCHYHLYRPNIFSAEHLRVAIDDNPKATDLTFHPDLDSDDLCVLKNEDFLVVAGGEFTGQLYILPSDFFWFEDDSTAESVAIILDILVKLYAEKFRSVEGLAPDYRWEFEIYGGGINFGIFVPKLNNTGTLEDMATMDRRRGFNLLWSHEETARYLKS